MHLNLRLSSKSPDEIKKILLNNEQLFKETLEYWNTDLFPEYVNQCYQLSVSKAAAYIFLPQDKNHEEYMKQRSVLYTFQIYNPQIKKYETKNFSSLIDNEPKIPEGIKNILSEYQSSINKIQQDNDAGLTNIEKVARKMLIQKIKETKPDIFPITEKKDKNIFSLIKQRIFNSKE